MLNQLQDVFVSLEKDEVKYLVIGGIAVVLHGVPGATFVLDLLIVAKSLQLLPEYTASQLIDST
ncbi:MAG: hypothetical protein ACE5HX_04805 [bacterium]